jgi:hypothetical protein
VNFFLTYWLTADGRKAERALSTILTPTHLTILT